MFPRASWLNLLASSPLVVAGVKSGSVEVLPVAAPAVLGDGNQGEQEMSTSPYLFNNATWDHQRNNTQGTLLASAARAITTSTADQTNYNARGAYLWWRISVVPGGDTLTLSIEATDPVSGVRATLFTDAPVLTTGLRGYLIYPGVAGASSDVAGSISYPLPRIWRATLTASGGGSFTYSLGYSLML